MTIGKDGYGKKCDYGERFLFDKGNGWHFLWLWGKSGYGGRWLWEEITVNITIFEGFNIKVKNFTLYFTCNDSKDYNLLFHTQFFKFVICFLSIKCTQNIQLLSASYRA
jgi:hypothetical protein